MSSNTLRGIGQEGDGDDDDAPATEGEASAGRPGQPILAHGRGEDRGASADPGKATEWVQEMRHVRSLDAVVPGTRSLDDCVPGARPSLDAKVPDPSATLMGMSAPEVRSARDKGTVQGRDVHLPIEVQRMAGVHAVAKTVVIDSASAPYRLDSSEPTRADPALAAALAQADILAAQRDATTETPAQPDLSHHTPWYDQDPTGGREIYDDPKPSVLGRAAIGVAVAAGLSVLVFAVIRLAGSGGEDGYARPPIAQPDPPASQAAPASAEAPTPPAAAAPAAPLPTAAPAAEAPTDDPLPSAVDPGLVRRTTDQQPSAGRLDMSGTDQGQAHAGANPVGPRAPLSQLGRPLSALPAASRSPAHPPRLGAPAPSTPPAIAAVQPPPLGSLPPNPPPVRAAADPGDPAPAPAAPPRPASADKPRSKATYDPDSTLPLNID